jgi:hypothetical protein
MSTLVEAYKNGTLNDITIICRNPLCKAVNMGTSYVEVIKAIGFDTYLFKCPHCKRIMKIDYDFNNEIKTMEKGA